MPSPRRLGHLTIALALLGLPVAAPGSASADGHEPSAFRALTPCRLLDTRTGPRVDGAVDLDVAGRCGVPEGATAVAVTITALRSDGTGYVAVSPAGSPPPETSAVNLRGGEHVANLQLVRLGDGGALTLTTSTDMHLLVDVAGAFEPASGPVAAGRFVPVTARRLLDTRTTRRPAAGGSVVVATGVPEGAAAAVVNVTVAATTGTDFVTAHAAGTPRPDASIVNADGPAQARSAAAIVPLADGAMELYTDTGSHLVVDLLGYVTGPTAGPGDDGLFVPVDPFRVADTRLPTGPEGGPRLHDGGGREFPLTELFDLVAADGASIGSVALNVTVTRTEDRGFVVVHPAGTPPGDTSSVNHESAQRNVANQVLAAVSERGVTVTAAEGTHVLLDVTGWFTGTPVEASGAVPSNPLPPERRVVVISDSAFAGIRWNGALAGFQGMDVDARLESCRRLVAASCRGREGYAPRTARSQIESLGRATDEDLLVIATGYNDWSGRFAEDFDVVVATARAMGYHHIAWITYRSQVGYSLPGGGRSNYGEMNRILWEKAAGGDFPDVRIWDYDTDTLPTPDGWLYGDGVHQRPLGSWGTADWISRQVAAFDERPCAQPWSPGEEPDDPCPVPGDVIAERGLPDIAALYGLDTA